MEGRYPDALIGGLFILRLHIQVLERNSGEMSYNESIVYNQLLKTLTVLYDINLFEDDILRTIVNSQQYNDMADKLLLKLQK